MSGRERGIDPAATWALAAAAALAVLALMAWAALLPPEPGPTTVPAARSLAALSPYLEPVADADELRGRGVPAPVPVGGDPFRLDAAPAGVAGAAGAGNAARPAPARAPRWSLTAILVSGDRRVAIIDDRLVRPGDRLDGGAAVAAIAADHVIITTPDGQRRRLDLER